MGISNKRKKAEEATKNSKAALKSGNRKLARKWIHYAIALDPQREENWLILAALSSPESSLKHFQRALKINRNSKKALKGINWALQRLEKKHSQLNISKIPQSIPTSSLVINRQYYPLWLILLIIFLGIIIYSKAPIDKINRNRQSQLAFAQQQIYKITRTPTFTSTITPTKTPSPTSTNTPTLTPTISPTHTKKPTATSSPTPKPNQKSIKKKVQTPQVAKRPKSVDKTENWIDIDLSTQRAYALTGDTIVKDFIVSTGIWLYPTVIGTFNIYVKYRYANMSGPGYFLPNVPYVMYFYKDYGLHGTYWHNNFGTPMSHGCINFKIKDAAWLFDFSTIGTTVNIHR